MSSTGATRGVQPRFQHGGKTGTVCSLSMLFRLGLLSRRAGPGLRPPVHPAGKHDAKYSTKGPTGISPAYPVSAACCSAENRDGNANVRFHQGGYAEEIFERLVKDWHGQSGSAPTAAPSRKTSSYNGVRLLQHVLHPRRQLRIPPRGLKAGGNGNPWR